MALSERDAALRAEAVRGILGAVIRLDGVRFRRDAFHSAVHDQPAAALLAIKRAEVRLRRAKAALRKWARGER